MEQDNRQAKRPVWVGYVVAIALNLALTLGLLLLSPVFPLGKFPIPYVLLVMITGYFFGGGPAIVAGIAGWLAFTSAFVPPHGLTWPIADSTEGWAREAAFFLGVSVVAIAAVQVRKANQRIQRLADETTRLNESLKREIEGHQQTEEALRESEERFRLMIEGLHDYAIFVIDPEGNVATWNAGAERMKGYSADEIIGKHFSIFYTDENRASGKPSQVLATAAKEGRYAEEGWRMRKDGSVFWASVTVAAMHNTAGELIGFAKITRDVTERKQAEEEVRKLNAELEQRVQERTAELQASNRELQTFSYSIMHDLRTPLRAIGGFSDALLRHYSSSFDDKGQDYLRRIGAAAQKMSRIIDDIHDLLRATRAKVHRQDVDMSVMAEEILENLKKSQPERKSDIKIEPGLIVNADPGLLRAALEHLLGNAWKFTSEREVTYVELASIKQNGNRVYLVRDNGAGFNPAYAGKLFEPFQRLHNESDFPGTGIGLALVQRILSRHGGHIWAESEIDKGATFYFTLEKSN